MVLACQTESQVLGIDCQLGIPRQAATAMAAAPSTTPAAAVISGHRGLGVPLTGPPVRRVSNHRSAAAVAANCSCRVGRLSASAAFSR